MMRQTTEVEDAIRRLWRVLPVGYGRDLNMLLKELERQQVQLNK